MKNQTKLVSVLRKILVGVLLFLAFIILLAIVIPKSETSNDINSSNDINKSLSISTASDKVGADVGETNKIYRLDEKAVNTDGSRTALNIQSIKKHSTFNANTGENISDVIVIQNVTDISVLASYFDNVGFIDSYDIYGNSISNFEIYTQSGSEFSEIILKYENAEDFSKVYFLMLGGLDKEKYHNGKILFEVK